MKNGKWKKIFTAIKTFDMTVKEIWCILFGIILGILFYALTLKVLISLREVLRSCMEISK